MSQYYRCLHCKSFLPKENYGYFLHVCFHNIDHKKQSLFINPQKCCIYLGNKKDYLENEINNSQLDQLVEIPHSKKLTKQGRKTNEWEYYDELLIDAVRNRSCLWNYSLKDRSTERLNQAWNDVLKDLDATNASTNEKSPIEIKKRKQECNMELYRELLNILKQQVISQPKELDVIGAFAKLVEECLRKLPYRKQKQLQRTIYNAMSKAEDECFEE
ncbi:hypothetical protein TKK_0008294 [Trichogramma kaykai]